MRDNLLVRALSFWHFLWVYGASRVLGIWVAVRYLRNPNPRISARLLRAFGAQLGVNTTVKGALYLDNVYQDENSAGDFSHLHIADNCYIGEGVFFDLAEHVHVASNALLSAQTRILTHRACERSEVV